MPHTQNARRVLLKGFRGGAQSKPSKGLLKSAEKGPQWLNGQKSADNPLKIPSADLFGVHIEMLKKGPRASGRRKLKARGRATSERVNYTIKISERCWKHFVKKLAKYDIFTFLLTDPCVQKLPFNETPLRAWPGRTMNFALNNEKIHWGSR